MYYGVKKRSRMKPKKAEKTINNLFDRYMDKEISTKLTTKELINELKKIKPELIRMRDKYKLDSGIDSDDRSGEETYGYLNLEKIEADLVYISDRWKCQFRVQWLLGLIEVD